MEKRFSAVLEDQPGESWKRHFDANWEATRDWYLSEGLEARPTAAECRAALARHMPQLLPIYDRVCERVSYDDVAVRALSLYGPPRVIPGCSQAVWRGPGGPALLRNYDFDPAFMSGRIEATRWLGRRCIVMSEAGWGCLDGMNEDGLVVSLTFGGSRAHGPGFAVLLALRYVLETCSSVKEAIPALSRIPVAMSQTVTLLDRTSEFGTLFLGPHREPAIVDWAVATNHQETVDWPESATLTRSVERRECLVQALGDRSQTLESLAERFFTPPLYNRDFENGFVTLYTAIYFPTQGAVEFRWPGKTWRQSFDRFEPGTYVHRFGNG